METPTGEADPEDGSSTKGPSRDDILDDEVLDSGRKRKRAALYSLPFLLFDLVDHAPEEKSRYDGVDAGGRRRRDR